MSGRFEVNTEFPGLSVEYSVDNGHTWLNMPLTPLVANRNDTIGYLFATRSEGSQLCWYNCRYCYHLEPRGSDISRCTEIIHIAAVRIGVWYRV